MNKKNIIKIVIGIAILIIIVVGGIIFFTNSNKPNTGVKELDKILKHFNKTGIMPNRARMYFAGKVFYESKTGIDALNTLIDTFDIIGLDGQCPNNYLQCISAMGLSYGKVMMFSADRTFNLLQYEN